MQLIFFFVGNSKQFQEPRKPDVPPNLFRPIYNARQVWSNAWNPKERADNVLQWVARSITSIYSQERLEVYHIRVFVGPSLWEYHQKRGEGLWEQRICTNRTCLIILDSKSVT
jgi:hypothetical protein